MRQGRRKAVTLVECLAAIALITIATAAVLPMLSNSSDAAQERAAVVGMLDLDRRARLAARRLGPAKLLVEESRVEIRVEGSDEPIAELALPRRVPVWILEAETESPLRSVAYARDGTATSYRLVVGEGEARRVWRVSGTTGWAQEVEP